MRGDLDLHFHQSIPPLSEGTPLDLDLGDSFVEFFFVLPLLFPHKHLLLCVEFESEGLDRKSVV